MNQLMKSVSVFCLTVLLMACGGGGSDGNGSSQDQADSAGATATLNGVVATGAPLSGTVEAVNAQGKSSGAVTIDADGSYTLTVEEGAPYMLKATSSDMATVLYSYAEQAGLVNVTSLTSLALFEAYENGDLEELFNEWASTVDRPTEEEIEQAQAVIVANFEDIFSNYEAMGEDFFTGEFEANGEGIDAVMDELSITINMDSGDVTVTGPSGELTFNPDIDTSGITDQLSGEWTLVVTGEVTANGITTSVPETTVEGIDAPEGGNTALLTSYIESQYPGIEELTITLVSESDNEIVYDISGTVSTEMDVEETGGTVSVVASYDLRYTYTR